MTEHKRRGHAVWAGDLKSGTGLASAGSGAFQDVPITFVSRFETGADSNPEELIAAAHAACFSMALSGALSRAGTPPDELRTEATLTLAKGDEGWRVTAIHLDTTGRVPGADQAAFQKAAEGAKETCPISVLLKPGLQQLTLTARLED